jgi:hypothetical protein
MGTHYAVTRTRRWMPKLLDRLSLPQFRSCPPQQIAWRWSSRFRPLSLAGDVLAGAVGHSHIEQMNAYPMQKRESLARSVI